MTIPIEHPGARQTFDAFALYTRDIWLTPSDQITESDHAMMALGLCGEAGEAIEELIEGVPVSTAARLALVLEMGDCIYYWARLAQAFGLKPGELAETAGLGERVPVLRLDLESVLARQTAAMGLAAATGRVAEVLKKQMARSHFDRPKFEVAMADTVLHWVRLSELCGLAWSDILRENRRKMASRYQLSDLAVGLA